MRPKKLPFCSSPTRFGNFRLKLWALPKAYRSHTSVLKVCTDPDRWGHSALKTSMPHGGLWHQSVTYQQALPSRPVMVAAGLLTPDLLACANIIEALRPVFQNMLTERNWNIKIKTRLQSERLNDACHYGPEIVGTSNVLSCESSLCRASSAVGKFLDVVHIHPTKVSAPEKPAWEPDDCREGESP